ncbi:hypothetical protein [[Leptolyngbya] sp. PCC 7376]|nr:hypothetical protein [[Leptolyngbya] sp. PCC 7376]
MGGDKIAINASDPLKLGLQKQAIAKTVCAITFQTERWTEVDVV